MVSLSKVPVTLSQLRSKNKCEYSTYFERERERERPHSHNFIAVYCYMFYFVIHYCCTSFTVPNLKIKLYHRDVCVGENIVYVGFSTTEFPGIPGGIGMCLPIINVHYSTNSL